ncbi:MAG: hypothetical protein MPK75_00910 [Alphaproteobacteria bacterium]|nr:hypothetical protein [Alphaproteobacteria bacterium]
MGVGMTWQEEIRDFTSGTAISMAALTYMAIGVLIVVPIFAVAMEAEDYDLAGMMLATTGGIFITPGFIISMIGNKIHAGRKKVISKPNKIRDHLGPVFGVVMICMGLMLADAVPKALEKEVPELATAALIGFITIFLIPGILQIAQYFLVTRDEIKQSWAVHS